MLSKFETKSNRVKGIAFHPKRPWVLAALHTGCIQLWDYKMGTLIDKFEEHQGPVRTVAFHPSQPLFVSGGDDYKVKVWNWKQRKCLFTLSGHLDYIRTVSFHHEHPWIISASDDQTIRIWNWQSRNNISVVTGHNHYVMSASFHPKENLIVSASMDQTVRIWDFTGLAKKHTTAQKSSISDMNDFQSRLANNLNGTPHQSDLFTNPDVLVRHVIEGHERGVNWASFHPTLPLVVSGGDDRQVKLWRMNETRAWEVDTFRGHFNNVSCAIFHPRADIILSNSEDKSIRVWDMNKRTTIHTFKRDNDRYWVLAAHPELNLFAAGHDNGLVVFKLERERPAAATFQDTVFYVKDKFVRMCDLNSGQDIPVVSLKKTTNLKPITRSLSYNPAEQAVILCDNKDGGSYQLYSLPKTASAQPYEAEADVKTGSGQSAVFVARNRFAVLDPQNEIVYIKDLKGETTKQFKGPCGISGIFYAGMKNILFLTPTSVVLYDTELKTQVAQITVSGVRYACWSSDMSLVALLSKHSIVIANKKLEQLSQIHETIKVKSGQWDDMGVFVYSTLNHIKYALVQGDNGIIKTLDNPIYISRVKANQIFCLDRQGNIVNIPFDSTEYRFKLALVNKEYDQVMQIIKTGNLIGQSVIAYLQKKGFSEIALFFVKDAKTRFDLALECGNLEIALETCKQLDRPEIWQELSMAALSVGNSQIVELCYQKLKMFEKLSFLYLSTGNVDKLKKMMKISEMRSDSLSKYQNAMFLGNVEEQLKVLVQVGQLSMAYLAAKTHGLEKLSEEILAQAKRDSPPVLPCTKSLLLKPPTAILKLSNENWPCSAVATRKNSMFEAQVSRPPVLSQESILDDSVAIPTSSEVGMNAGSSFRVNSHTGVNSHAGVNSRADTTSNAHPQINYNANAADLSVDAGAGWGDDLELDLKEPTNGIHRETYDAGWGIETDLQVSPVKESFIETSTSEFIMPTNGTRVTDIWIRNSGIAADHIAAGNLTSAMQLLHRQLGIVNFGPLKPLFLQIFGTTRTFHKCNYTLPCLSFPLYRQWDSDYYKVLPFVCVQIEMVITKINEAYQLTTAGRFAEVVVMMKQVLQQLVFVVAADDQQAAQIQQFIATCREYIRGLSMEISRRELNAETQVQRMVELAAYFTHCNMLSEHLQLSLRSAMAVCYRVKNLGYAGIFAKRLLDTDPASQIAQQARAIQQRCDITPTNAIALNYDHHNQFDVCAKSFTVILKGNPVVHCPYCGSAYQPQFKGKLCFSCELSEIGLGVSGMKNSV